MTLDRVWNVKELLSCVNNDGIYLLPTAEAPNDGPDTTLWLLLRLSNWNLYLVWVYLLFKGFLVSRANRHPSLFRVGQ